MDEEVAIEEDGLNTHLDDPPPLPKIAFADSACPVREACLLHSKGNSVGLGSIVAGLRQLLPQCSDVVAGLSYIVVLVRSNLPVIVIGLVLGALPAALLANLAGESMVSKRSSGEAAVGGLRANMAYIGWTPETPSLIEPAGILAFDAFRVFALAISSDVCMVCMMVAWRGAAALRRSRLFWTLIVIRHVLMSIVGNTRSVLFVYGKVPAKTWLVYVTQVPAIVIFQILSPACMAVLAPAGARRRTAVVGLCFTMLTTVIFLGSGFIVQKYQAASTMTTKVALALVNGVVIFSLAMGLTKRILDMLPGGNARTSLVGLAFMLAIPITCNWMMQSATEDLTTTLMANLVVTGPEVARHLLLLRGVTDVAIWRFLWRFITRSRVRISPVTLPDSILPVQNNNDYVQSKDGGHALAAQAPAPEVEAQDKVDTSSSSYLISVVAVLNGLELMSLLVVTVVQLVAKMSPQSTDAEPLHWQHTLSRFGISLGTELICDCVTASYATKWARSLEEDSSPPSTHGEPEVRSTSAQHLHTRTGLL